MRSLDRFQGDAVLGLVCPGLRHARGHVHASAERSPKRRRKPLVETGQNEYRRVRTRALGMSSAMPDGPKRRADADEFDASFDRFQGDAVLGLSDFKQARRGITGAVPRRAVRCRLAAVQV